MAEASTYETRRIKDRQPLVFSIWQKNTDLVFDYTAGGPQLGMYPYHGQGNQQFSISLDIRGYYQIVQNGNKFLHLNSQADGLIGGSFSKDDSPGFLLWAEDGSTCYNGHNEGMREPRFDFFGRKFGNPLRYFF